MRRVGSCLAYELNKETLYTLGSSTNVFQHRLLMSEGKIEMRKWRLYSKLVTKIDTLDPDQLALQQEQLEMIQRGRDILVLEDEHIVKVWIRQFVKETFSFS